MLIILIDLIVYLCSWVLKTAVDNRLLFRHLCHCTGLSKKFVQIFP